MQLISRLLTLVLSFQLAFGINWYSSTAHAETPEYLKHPNLTGNIELGKNLAYDKGVMSSLDNLSKEWLEKGTSDPTYQEEVKELYGLLEQKEVLRAPRYNDSFLLGMQEVRDLKAESVFALTDLTERGSIPLVPAAFKGDVEISNDLETKEFKLQFIKKDQVVVEHVFKNRSVIAHFEDASHIYTLEKSGAIYAAPKKVLFQTAFKSPVPWVKIAKLNNIIMKEVLRSPEKVELFGATGGMRDFQSFHKEGVFPLQKDGNIGQWKAGDLVVRVEQEQGKRQALGIYSFEAIRANATVGLQVLGRQMDLLLENADLIKGRKPGDMSQELSGNETKLNIKADLLQSNQKVLDSILVEAYNSGFLAKNSPQRHIITNDQLAKDYEVLVKNAKLEGLNDKDLEEELRNNWDKYVLTEKEAKKGFWSKYTMHLMVLGGAATFVGLDYSFYLMRYGELPIYLSNSVSFLYDLMGQHMLDADYRWVNLGSMLFLVSMVGLIYVTGKNLGKKIGKDAPAAILHYSLKLWALVIYPVFRALAKAAGQPLFLDAMKSGLNPFHKIRAESELGKKLELGKDTRIAAGLPVYRNSENNERVQRQKKIVSQLAQADIRKQSMAFVLGVGVTARKYGIDVDVLYKAIKSRQSLDLAFMNVGKDYLNKEKVLREAHKQVPNPKQKAILDSIDYIKEVDLATKDIFIELLELKEAGLKPLENVSRQEVDKYYEMAEQTVKKFGASKLKRKARHILFDTKNYAQRKFVGSSGEGSAFEFFWNVEPNRPVIEEYWNGFKTDYVASSVQMGLIAARSWMHNPVALAADPASLTMTYRPHFAGMAEQVFIHMLPAAADKAYTFADKEVDRYERPTLEDERYRPMEYVSLLGEHAEESFYRSVISVLKKSSNLIEANYPMVFLRSQYNSFRTIRAGMIIGLPTLMAAGLSFTSSIASYLYIKAGAIWAFTAYWYIEGYAVKAHKDQLTHYQKMFTEAKAEISQAIRLRDSQKLLKGYEDLKTVYRENQQAFNFKNRKFMNKKLLSLQKELNLSVSEFRDLKKNVVEHYALIAQISNAIESGDKEAIEKAEEKLRRYADYPEEFKDAKVNDIEEAKELLKYSLRHPPINASMNEKAHYAFLIIGAVLTTYLATGFFADAVDLETNKWGLLAQGLAITAGFYAVIFGIQFVLKAFKLAYDKGSGFDFKLSKNLSKAVSKVRKKPELSNPIQCRYSFSKANRGKQ